MRRSDLIEHLAEHGHHVQHATLSKWLRVVHEETGVSQEGPLEPATAMLMVSTLDHLRNLTDHGYTVTFREALKQVVDASWQPMPGPDAPAAGTVTVTLTAEDAGRLQEILAYAVDQANWQQAIMKELGWMRSTLERLSEDMTDLRDPDTEEKNMYFRGAQQAARLANGFVISNAEEGFVAMLRTSSRPPEIVPWVAPTPEPSWWERG